MHTRLGYSTLNPLQEKAIAEGLLSKERMVVSAPTASGKTLLALMSILDNFKKTKTKALYLVPLRALASEKFDEFSEKLAPHGLSIAIATGDLDSSSEQLHSYDVIIVTSEKMDSLLRHKTPWIDNVGLVVCDEVHLIGDGARGATLEIVLTKMLQQQCRLLCLSATIPNALEIADWLEARLVVSEYRPTPLHLGVFDGKKLELKGTKHKVSEGFGELIQKALSEKPSAQILVFVSTRRNAESFARELMPLAFKTLSDEEKEECAWLSEKALKALGTPTAQCKILAECLKNGIAFHHAGLPSAQRRLIERGFKKDRCVKVIVCTTTLAMGIDYPASWVVVKDLKRFNGAFAEFVPALEIAQMTGRAGRPNYDSEGIAVLCSTPSDSKRVREKYLSGILERIHSQLSSEPVLRSHVLALIASQHANDFKSLFEFFQKTFFAFQYSDLEELYALVEKVVFQLKEMDFVREKGGFLLATPIGKRVSELYVDPVSAYSFSQFVKKGKTNYFDYLMELNNATESRPLLNVKQDEEMKLWDELYAWIEDEDMDRWENDFGAVAKFKSAKALNAWVNEASEAQVMLDFDLAPGSLHARALNSEWLCYAMQEISFLLNQATAYKTSKILRKRIKTGVKEELLDLCKMKGIGRHRARKLFDAGIKTSEELKVRPKDEIRKILKGV
ncbi:MAG TPA: DEAD/DEAH box helicase [Candidatus Norongarragalinales archaeon]|nr:DEAD/DEAH box helicase [Candidatus Norongarragalinales archaeon]